MDITCTSCSTKLSIPDAKVPKNAAFKVTCPKCQTKSHVSTKGEGAASPAEAMPAGAAPPSSAPPSPSSEPQSPSESTTFEEEDLGAMATTEDDFVEDQKLAIICFDQPQRQSGVKAAIEALGYTVHVPTNPTDAIQRIRQNR